MAEAVAVDTWDARGVRVGEVVDALGDLRNAREMSATRTAVMTLVAVAESDDAAYAATEALHALGGHHPARIVIIRPDPDGVAALDARAALYSSNTNDHEVNFEEIVLTVGGQAALHLDSLVEAFTLADLPIAVWYVGTAPDPRDSLLSVATAVMLDSRDLGGAGELRNLLELARRRTVVDLSWIRLRPWRELLASLFDPPTTRGFVSEVTHAEVHGKPAPRLLLGGWLLSQLRLTPAQMTLVDSRHVGITLAATSDGEVGTFDVQRADGSRTVWAGFTIPTGPSLRQQLALADDPLATSVAEALTHLEPDAVWERALAAAAQLGV